MARRRSGPIGVNPTAGSILGFLDVTGPLTGWDLDQVVDMSIGRFWNVTRSQVYRELRDLAGRGLVVAGRPGPRERTPYAITDDGRVALRAWLAEDQGPDVIRHRLLLTVFFGHQLAPGRLAEVLATQRVDHERSLAHYRGLQRDLDGDELMAATLRFGVSYEEMVIAWIDSVGAGTGAVAPMA